MRLTCSRAYHLMGFGCIGESCTDPRGENGLCTVPKRLANMRRLDCVCPWFHISHKKLIYLLQSFASFIINQSTTHMPQGKRLVGVNHRVLPTRNNTRISTRNRNAHTSSPCLFNFQTKKKLTSRNIDTSTNQQLRTHTFFHITTSISLTHNFSICAT